MMRMKRLLALAAALVMLFGIGAVRAEEAARSVEYVGGVVRRLIPRDDPNAEYINIAYIRGDDVYPIVGNTYDYQVVLSGGVAPYEVAVTVWIREFGATNDYFYFHESLEVDEDYGFSVTYERGAEYFLSADVTDQEGQFVSFQGTAFETYMPEDENDPTTVPGKVNQIVREEIKPGMSDYAKAKALHDWLIFNADYDETLTIRDAGGVLLKGTGVCDSYAKAYQLLMTAVGIECIRVTGSAGGDHAWNMIKLNGSWYHVDATWDDPVGGGNENWNYFCISDEQMAKDHIWNQDNTPPTPDRLGIIAPETDKEETGNGGQVSDAAVSVPFATVDDVLMWMNQVAQSGKHPEQVELVYTGAQSQWGTIYNAVFYELWGAEQTLGFNIFNELIWGDYRLTFDMRWGAEADNYLILETAPLDLSVGDTEAIKVKAVFPADSPITWTSQDPGVVTVSAQGVATGVSAGETTITASVASGDTQTVFVKVRGPHEPDFAPQVTASGEGVTLTWNSIPGVTEYTVMRTVDGVATELATVSDATVQLTSEELPENESCQIYIVANRRVAGEIQLSYTSKPVSYGKVMLSFSTYVPVGITAIDAEAFRNTAMGNVYLPDGLVSIGANAFADCTMAAVRVPASVASIGSGAFNEEKLQYAQVVQGSAAHEWFADNLPGVELVFE